MKRRVSMWVVPVLLLAAGPLQAQDGDSFADYFSGNVSLWSDYSFRGFSQTLGEPAIQGGMDFRHPSGIYLGTWGSNVNFGEDLAGGSRASAEVDVYGGFGFSLLPVATFDVGAIYYVYPGAEGDRNYDFLEVGLGASRTAGPLSAGLSAKYSPDFFGGLGDAFYYGASLGAPISIFTISGNVGKQMFDDDAGVDDYLDWGVGASAGWAGFTAGARVIGTDIDSDSCAEETCDTRVVFSLGRTI